MTENKGNTGGLSRDVIKMIAMGTMLINHIAIIFMPWSLMREACIDVGYFTAITMCFFMVEGYEHTGSVKKYGMRLFVFALISQVPFTLAFTRVEIFRFTDFNMIVTLFLCFLIICTMNLVGNPALRWLAVFGLIWLTKYCDWPYYAAIFTTVFCVARGRSRRQLLARDPEADSIEVPPVDRNIAWAYLACIVIYAAGNLFEYRNYYQTMSLNLMYTAGKVAGPVASALVILLLYNGERGFHSRNLSRWFFYLFYPVHLLILGIIRVMLLT